MVQCLGLNSANDIYLGADGNIVLQNGIDAIATACGTISRSRLGEMVLTSSQGLPYFETVWRGIPNVRIWQSYLYNALLNVDGVQEVSNIVLSSENNILSFKATVKTQFGSMQISG